MGNQPGLLNYAKELSEMFNKYQGRCYFLVNLVRLTFIKCISLKVIFNKSYQILTKFLPKKQSLYLFILPNSYQNSTFHKIKNGQFGKTVSFVLPKVLPKSSKLNSYNLTILPKKTYTPNFFQKKLLLLGCHEKPY